MTSLGHHWKLSEETRHKMSIALRGNKRNLGHKNSEESRKKVSMAKTGKHYPKLHEAMLGHRLSEETKRKIGLARIGKKASEKTKKKLSDMSKGNLHPNWKGGISKEKTYSSFMSRRRVIRKTNNGGSHTLAEWELLKAQYNWTCPACKRKEPEIKLTEDHIIPLSKGGSDNIENIQPLCPSCNSKKHTKIITYKI